MGLYLRVAAKSFQKNLAYRAANLAGIATNTFFGAVYVLVYVALFEGRGEIGGLDVRDTITYAIVAQSLLMVMSAFGNQELSQAIIKGQVAADMVRPIDFYFYWGAIDLGRAAYYLVFRGLPTYLIGALLFGVRTPAGWQGWLLFLVAITTGALLSFAFRFITNSLAFWATDARGILMLANTLILFFAGFIVPPNFFPDWLRSITEALPFASLAQTPISVYLGKVSGSALALALLRLAAWFLALVAVGRWLLSRMVRRVTIAGG